MKSKLIESSFLVLLFLSGLFVQRADAQMSAAEVRRVIAQATTRALEISPESIIAVVDREGFVLGVWTMNPNPQTNSLGYLLDVEDAITKAGTASFLSHDQHAFTSRTAGYIVQQNFPPGIKNRPNGPLVGVNFSNMSFTDVNRFKNPNGYSPLAYGGSGTNGGSIEIASPFDLVAALSGLAGTPGGVPLFRDGKLIGGVGVSGTSKRVVQRVPALDDLQVKQVRDTDEEVALAGQIGFAPASKFFGTHVLIDGIRVPYVIGKARPIKSVFSFGSLGAGVPEFPVTNSPAVDYPKIVIDGMTNEVRAPVIDDPIPEPINGQARLTAEEVTSILTLSARRAYITRAGIRLPRGQPAQVFIAVVNNPNSEGVSPTVLGTLRTPGATMFSWDVAVQKARTSIYFSEPSRKLLFEEPVAMSSRTVGFLAQSFYPPGIKGSEPGPFLGIQELFSQFAPISLRNPLNGVQSSGFPPVDPNVPNGITIFPGGFPLYRNGVMIGAIGVSGDGIDQDDIIAASGTVNFLPPDNMRADRFYFRHARLPYAKFPRNPSL